MLARLLQNSPIWAKAFAASVVLWFCLGMLGATAYLTLDRSTRGLSQLRDTSFPKQNMVSELTHNVMETHVKLFRQVTWASNGVSPVLLRKLSKEIRSNLAALSSQFRSLPSQHNLKLDERQSWIALQTKWRKYDRAVRDTLDVAATDAPMATMMLGGTDDDFQQVENGLQHLSAQANERTRLTIDALASEAESRKWFIAVGGLAGGLISILMTLFVARSIVAPIRSVTEAMARLSLGETDLGLGGSGRKDEIGQMINAMDLYRKKLKLQSDELHTQNLRFDTALNNMSQGLAMFDARQRLVVCNDRYLTIYGWSRGSVRPGMLLKDMLGERLRSGLLSEKSLDLILNGTMVSSSDETRGACYTHFNDGRCIAIFAQAMPDGGTVTTHEDVTDRRRVEAQIVHMAHHDALTGLANRVLLRERLETALSRCGENQVALFCLDLDRFKEVNDTMGHPAGDALLQMVANRLSNCIREAGTVARLGGDEFAIVADCSEPEAGAIASRTISDLSQPYDLDGQRIVIGVSIGIALAPKDGSDADLLLKNADLALYRAKADSRNAYRLFEPEMDSRRTERHKLEHDLREALLARELEVHYQSICALDSGSKIGMEALVRWRHPIHGLMSPDSFIPLAEETGLIDAIGEFVLRRACAEAVKWPSRTKIAVNLSAVQFRDPDLARHIAAVLAETGLSSNRLELEITESVLLTNSASHIGTLHELRALGVSIALDDFGTGFSSLSYLRTFQFDKIKIDRSFVNEMTQTDTSAAIVCAVASLARSLDIITTAEGVETREQLELLRAAGCTQGQGYLFGRPVPAVEVDFENETDVELAKRVAHIRV